MKKKLFLVLISTFTLRATAWTPLQLELGPDAACLFNDKTDVYGLRLAVVGKNQNVYGFDLSLDRAIVNANFSGLQFAAVCDVIRQGSGFQLGVLHARSGAGFGGLQTSVLWAETDQLRGGQLSIYNDARSGTGLQLGLLNWTDDSFCGLSLAAVAVAGSIEPAAQIGLLWNSVSKASSGMQLGLIDIAEHYRGLQIGLVDWRGNGGGAQVGLYNDADNISGLQVGVASIAHRICGIQLDLLGSGAYEVRGVQSGAVNIAGKDGQLDGDVVGLQIGLLNRLGTLQGAQFGVLNDAQACHGAQIGLLNRTTELSGLQLGLLNFSSAGGLRVSPGLNFAF